MTQRPTEDELEYITNHKGILTKIDVKDISHLSLINLICFALKRRIKQGQQYATIVLHKDNQKWVSHFFVKPIICNKIDHKTIKTMAHTIYTITKC